MVSATCVSQRHAACRAVEQLGVESSLQQLYLPAGYLGADANALCPPGERELASDRHKGSHGVNSVHQSGFGPFSRAG